MSDIQNITANLDLKHNLNIFTTCKQFDSLNLILNIFDNSLQADLSNYDVRLKAMKADKIPLIQEHIGIDIDGNVVNIDADEQLTTTAGKTPIELQFINKTTGKKKATFNLVLIVVPSTVNINGTISTATYTLLEELEAKLDQASDFLENIDTAIDANSELQDTIASSGTAKSNLDGSISTGNTLKTNLNNVISTGNTLKTNLENDISTGNTLKNNLEDTITTGDSLLDALETFEQEHADVTDISNQLANINADLSQMMNICRIIKTIEKLRNNIPIRIGIFGDSLVDGAGATPYWYTLFFTDDTYQYNIKKIFPNANITVDNYAVGGSTGRQLLSYIAVEKDTSQIWNDYTNSVINKSEIKELPPSLSTKYDLIIISEGNNGGTDHTSCTELFIRAMKQNGCDVILCTGNPRNGAIWNGYLQNYKTLANVYSCGIADTYSYMKNAYDNGVSYSELFNDTIHCGVVGHQIWCRCFYDLLNVRNPNESDGYKVKVENLEIPKELVFPAVNNFTNLPIIQFVPSSTDGTYVSNTGGVKDPIYNRSGYSGTNLLKLNTGNYAVYGNGLWQSCDLIVKGTTDFTIDIKTYDITTGAYKTIKTITNNGQNGKPTLYEITNIINTLKASYDYCNHAIRIVCTSGSINIIGILFNSLATKKIDINTFTYPGTYSIVNDSLQIARPTVGDTIRFTFRGNALILNFEVNRTACALHIAIDNRSFDIDLLLYSSDNRTNKPFVFSGFGKGKHNVQMTVTQAARETIAGVVSFNLNKVAEIYNDYEYVDLN